MSSTAPTWQPRYTLTPAIVRGLVVAQTSRRARAYALSAIYRQFIGNAATRGSMTTHPYSEDHLVEQPAIERGWSRSVLTIHRQVAQHLFCYNGNAGITKVWAR